MGKHGADRKGNLQKRKDGRWEGQYTASRPLETGAILTTTSRKARDIGVFELYSWSWPPEYGEVNF